jgi:TolA-binding protein
MGGIRMSEDVQALFRDVLQEELIDVRRILDSFQNELVEFRSENINRLIKIENTLDQLEQRVETMEKGQEEIIKRLDKIEHDYDRMDRKVASIIVQTQHLESFFGSEIKRALSGLDKLQTIDLLSARSIQHEAYIKELHRAVVKS